MVSITCVVCCLVFTYGVSGESPTPSDDWLVESSTLEKSTTDEEWTHLDTIYQLMSIRETDESNWVPYSPETYPFFRKAIKEIAASEEALLVFWKTFNRDAPPKEFLDQVFNVHNRLASEDSASSMTEGSEEATTYRLATTDPHVPEVTDVYTIKNRVTSMDDSGVEYHTGVSHDGDESVVYYTTESPIIETMLADEAIYGSAVSSEDQGDTNEESKDAYAASLNNVYEAAIRDEVSGGEETNDASENVWGNLERRSGIVEEYPSADVHCEGCPLQVGSIRAIPGVHFPNYDDIPITSFSCADKHVPGFYADLETGCQVFHVCWPHRRESFLCPTGTLFNQAILACDYWYSTNCSLSTLYFDVTTLSPKSTTPDYEKPTPSKFPETTEITEPSTEWFTTESYFEKPTEVPDERPHVDLDWFHLAKFLPIKSKVTVYSKHSGKKHGSKWVVKQKHDVLPLVEEFLESTKNVAQKAIRLVPKAKMDVVKPSISKSKLAKVKPAAKLRPCLKIEDITVKPQKPMLPVEKPQPLSKLDPHFIVKPFVAKKRPVFHVKKEHFYPDVPVQHVKAKHDMHHAPEIVLKALEMAGNVLQRDILDLTRQALAESHVSSLKSKH